ncbi:MAG: hypothetical protein ACFCUI_02015 [Bernardetiaceae bacterium]
MNIVDENKRHRFTLLFSLYIASEADYDHAMNLEMLGQNRGLRGKDLKKSYNYLKEEGFITPKEMGPDLRYHASITHKGVKAVEEVFRNEYEPTYYFPPYREMIL